MSAGTYASMRASRPRVKAAGPPARVRLTLSRAWNPCPALRLDRQQCEPFDLYSCVHESDDASGQSRPGFDALPAVNTQTSRRGIKSDSGEGSGLNWRRAIGHPVRSPRPSSSGAHRCLFRLTAPRGCSGAAEPHPAVEGQIHVKAPKPMAPRPTGAGDQPGALRRQRPFITRGVITCCDALATREQQSNCPAPSTGAFRAP